MYSPWFFALCSACCARPGGACAGCGHGRQKSQYPQTATILSHLPPQEFARKLITSASAIHSKGIIHRDIKPTNILITEGGEVLLIDLGAAADLKVGTNFAEDESVLDQLYGPPEQYVEFQRGNSLFFDLTCVRAACAGGGFRRRDALGAWGTLVVRFPGGWWQSTD